MGMSIDKTIEFFNGLECYTPQAKDAKDVAIETMRKYKKIEQLYYAWIATLPPKNAEEFLIKIGEVIVDKNDNLDIKQFERF